MMPKSRSSRSPLLPQRFFWQLPITLVALALLGAATVGAQLIQGTDYQGTTPDPSDWTAVKLNTQVTGSTITFKLNPCQYVLYLDSGGRPKNCLPQLACTKLEDMSDMLDAVFAVWNGLAEDALTLVNGGVLGGSCPESVNDCPADIWQDDDSWVVTRTYSPTTEDFNNYCQDHDTGPQTAGAGLRFYYDDPNDHTTRRIDECDVVFHASHWDNDDPACSNYKTSAECQAAWRMALAHEIGHCLGLGHSYLTRKTLQPLAAALDLEQGVPSIMSYDRIGSIDLASNGLGPYDTSVYLYNYAADPNPNDDFTAYGTVKEGNCPTGTTPLYGAAVFALEVETSTLKPVNLSMTGVAPLAEGVFSLRHLDRTKSYKLLVADSKNGNQMLTNGWDFTDAAGETPGFKVRRTDVWDEDHSGYAYQYDQTAKFATGFDYLLTGAFAGPESGDYDAGVLCVSASE